MGRVQIGEERERRLKRRGINLNIGNKEGQEKERKEEGKEMKKQT